MRIVKRQTIWLRNESRVNTQPLKRSARPKSGEEGLIGKNPEKGIHEIHTAPFAGFGNGEDSAKDLLAAVCAETASHLLTVFALSQVPFAHVVVKGDVKIPEKEKVVNLVFLQPVQ